jgi:hypothetical protein
MTRKQLIDALDEVTDYKDTEIVLNIDYVRSLISESVGQLKSTTRVVRDNERLRRRIRQMKFALDGKKE